MKTMFALLACVSASACTMAHPPVVQHVDPAAAITLEKGGCGYVSECPAYRMSIKPDGAYSYEGYCHVPVIGVREGKLAADTWVQAEAAFVAADWQTLEDPTSRAGGFPCMPDSPFARITRRVSADEAKVFSFSLGCDSERGAALLNAINGLLAAPAE
jgi:hypothetical protein